MGRIDDFEIGGNEPGPVRLRLYGNRDKAAEFERQGRILLGNLKAYMQLHGITQFRTKPVVVPGGAEIIVMSFNGTSTTDEIHIFYPFMKKKGEGELCVGYIIRQFGESGVYYVNVDLPVGTNKEFYTYGSGYSYDGVSTAYTTYNFPGFPDYGAKWFDSYYLDDLDQVKPGSLQYVVLADDIYQGYIVSAPTPCTYTDNTGSAYWNESLPGLNAGWSYVYTSTSASGDCGGAGWSESTTVYSYSYTVSDGSTADITYTPEPFYSGEHELNYPLCVRSDSFYPYGTDATSNAAGHAQKLYFQKTTEGVPVLKGMLNSAAEDYNNQLYQDKVDMLSGNDYQQQLYDTSIFDAVINSHSNIYKHIDGYGVYMDYGVKFGANDDPGSLSSIVLQNNANRNDYGRSTFFMIAMDTSRRFTFTSYLTGINNNRSNGLPGTPISYGNAYISSSTDSWGTSPSAPNFMTPGDSNSLITQNEGTYGEYAVLNGVEMRPSFGIPVKVPAGVHKAMLLNKPTKAEIFLYTTKGIMRMVYNFNYSSEYLASGKIPVFNIKIGEFENISEIIQKTDEVHYF